MRILLIFAAALTLFAAPPNTKYAIAVAPRTAGGTGQTVINAFIERLNAKGFQRVPTLDVQCCAIRIEIATASPLTIRVTLQDIDGQPAYSHVYKGKTATAIADSALADPDFMKTLSETATTVK